MVRRREFIPSVASCELDFLPDEASSIPEPKSLIHKWIRIEGMGVGQVMSYEPASLIHASTHHVNFQYSGGEPQAVVKLRHKTTLRGWSGLKFVIVPDPNPMAELFSKGKFHLDEKLNSVSNRFRESSSPLRLICFACLRKMLHGLDIRKMGLFFGLRKRAWTVRRRSTSGSPCSLPARRVSPIRTSSLPAPSDL